MVVRKLLWEWRRWVVVLGTVIAFLALATALPSVEACVQQANRARPDLAKQEYPLRILTALRARSACDFAFLISREGEALVSAFATIVIAIFAGILWTTAREQSKLAREALITDRRAFVFARGFEAIPEFQGTGIRWFFRPIWFNSGKTPTRNLRFYVDCEIRTVRLPATFDFNKTRSDPTTGMLGPKAETWGPLVPNKEAAISPQDIVDIQLGSKFLYLWGWVKYNDVFAGTPEHVTRFCWQIIPTGHPLKMPGTPDAIIFGNAQVPEGTCSDDECASMGLP
jgi:hypothetical protein